MEAPVQSTLSASIVDSTPIETWNQQRNIEDMRSFVENRLQLLADEPELV